MTEVLGTADPRPRTPGAAAVGLTATAVLTAALLALPEARREPPVLTAEPTGVSTSGGRLRVWLALEGPPAAPLERVEGTLPGAAVEADGLSGAFSRRGVAAVRLVVQPRCPAALHGLASARLRVTVGPDVVEVPFSTDGLLADAVRARCVRTPAQSGSDAQPVVRSHRSVGDAVRLRVRLTAAGSVRQDVLAVLPGHAVTVDPVTPLPVGVPRGGRRDLLVDLRPVGCAPSADVPLLRLRYARLGPVVPRVDEGVRTRLEALRAGSCSASHRTRRPTAAPPPARDTGSRRPIRAGRGRPGSAPPYPNPRRPPWSASPRRPTPTPPWAPAADRTRPPRRRPRRSSRRAPAASAAAPTSRARRRPPTPRTT